MVPSILKQIDLEEIFKVVFITRSTLCRIIFTRQQSQFADLQTILTTRHSETKGTIEAGHRDKGDDSVELVLGLLVIIALAGETNTDATGNILDSTSPHHLVQLGVNPHVLRAHHLLGCGLEGLDSRGGALLELTRDGGRKLGTMRRKKGYRPWTYLCRWMVVSRVITSATVERLSDLTMIL